MSHNRILNSIWFAEVKMILLRHGIGENTNNEKVNEMIEEIYQVTLDKFDKNFGIESMPIPKVTTQKAIQIDTNPPQIITKPFVEEKETPKK